MVRFRPVGHKVDISLKVRRVPLTGDWFMSSANIRMIVPEEKVRDDRSLMYERNNRGPKTEP